MRPYDDLYLTKLEFAVTVLLGKLRKQVRVQAIANLEDYLDLHIRSEI
ncbi:MAG: hypothetical protein RMY29_003670 [Nostoc sp. CreGUA01]|nr:hypothetical protein [Nostoc sp. CreGUA01]